MPIQIEIKDDHIRDMIEFYSTKQKSLRDQISKLEKDLRDISATINQLKQRDMAAGISTAKFLSDSEVYSSKWPWAKKIAYIINETGRPLTTKEIVDALEIYEPKTEEERRSAISSVSSTLSVKSGKYSDKRDFIKAISESGEFAFDIWREDKQLENRLENLNKSYGSHIVIDDLPF